MLTNEIYEIWDFPINIHAHAHEATTFIRVQADQSMISDTFFYFFFNILYTKAGSS